MLNKFLHNLKRLSRKTLILPKHKVQDVAQKTTGRKKIATGLPSSHQVFSIDFLKYCLLKFKMMSTDSVTNSILKPPQGVFGMTVLDKSAFTKLIKVPSITVPLDKLNAVKKLKAYHLKIPQITNFIELEDDNARKSSHKLILLDPTKIHSFSNFEKSVANVLSENGISEDDFKEYEVKLTYDNWTCHDILHAVIPENVSGYTSVGHICHFNLRDEVLQYKNLIGEVVLDKIPGVKTVVNKLSNIDNTYRSFHMELLAGEPNFITQTKENGCVFELDFSQVYWNSRLGSEHQRVIDCISKGDILYDVFAGVGPFAVPAVKKKKAIVFANDLNPTSYKYLMKNVQLNKVKEGFHCFNMDGREFIKSVVKDDLINQWTKLEKSKTIHIVMNLPALAIEFLDAFKDLFAGDETLTSKSVVLPKVYCYCFTDIKINEDKDKQKEVRERVKGVVGDSVETDLAVRFVRNVAPNKDMMCVTFTLTREVLFGQKSLSYNHTGEPEAKYRKIEETSAANSC